MRTYGKRSDSLFQSTLPQGKWQCGKACRVVAGLFQSTLPQGKWQPIYWEILLILYFNPHFRKGSDSDSNHGDQQVFHFNPHFRKGSDRFLIFCLRLLNIFQSTLPQGKWLVTPYKIVSKWHFNPHFRKGSDYPVRNIPASPDNFNPHFRKGSDRKGKRSGRGRTYFNPHFCKGSDCRKGQDPSERYDFNPHFRKGSDHVL